MTKNLQLVSCIVEISIKYSVNITQFCLRHESSLHVFEYFQCQYSCRILGLFEMSEISGLAEVMKLWGKLGLMEMSGLARLSEVTKLIKIIGNIRIDANIGSGWNIEIGTNIETSGNIRIKIFLMHICICLFFFAHVYVIN